MLTTVVIRSTNTDFYPDLTIPVVDPSPDQPLFVHNITGLEPPPATVNSRGYGSLDGEFYVGSRVGKRNIVMTFGLNTDGGYASVDAARKLLSGYALPRNEIWLRFISSDFPPVDIAGYVESGVPNRFSQDPDVQLSVICPMPNFTGIEAQQFTGMASDNPTDTVVPYRGSLGYGISLTMDLPGSGLLGSIFVEIGISPGSYRSFEIQDVVSYEGDVFAMDSRPNNKFVEIRPQSGPAMGLLSYVTDTAYWPYLQPADNLVRVRTPDSSEEVEWTLTFTEQFAGI